jgi:nucleoside-diphosphate-sugar epimerase
MGLFYHDVKWENMRILVTGGAGVLGSHLCDRLIEERHEVWCVDNLSTGSQKNIDQLIKNRLFHFVKADITQEIPEIAGPDQIYHLASPASPNIHSKKSYHTLAFETMQVNTNGTWKLAELATETKAKMLFTSTSETYGDPLQHPQTESYRGNVSTTGPRSVYDEAKRFGETIMAAFIRSRGLDGRIVRIFNTYGPRMAPDDGRVVTEFIQEALANKPISIFGDGKQTRSFCYVDDLVDGLIKAMNEASTKGEIINLGNPGEFTILELADLVRQLTASKSKILFTEKLPEDDPLKRCPDITKAQKLLGWTPKVSLKQGLVMLINESQKPI